MSELTKDSRDVRFRTQLVANSHNLKVNKNPNLYQYVD